MKKILSLFFILLFATCSHAAVVTVVQSGNSSNSSTWSAAPTGGDTFVLPAGMTLTVDQDITFAGGTVESLVGGGLVVNAKLTLTGALNLGNGSGKDGCLTFGPGSELALTSANVVMNNCRMRSTSTSENWARVTGTGSFARGTVYTYPKQDIILRYVAFTATGDWYMSCDHLYGNAALVSQCNATNITIVNAGNITLGRGGVTAATTNLRLNDSDIRDYTGSISLSGLDKTTGAREFLRNTISNTYPLAMRGLRIMSSGYDLTGCVFDRAYTKSSAAGVSGDPATLINVFHGSNETSDDYTNGFGYLGYAGSVLESSYLYIPPGAANPHVGGTIQDGRIKDNVFEVYGSEPNIVGSGTTAMNTAVNVTGNVFIGSGSAFNQVGNNAGNGTINFLHNTVFTKANTGDVHQGLFLAENGNFAGTLNIKSNINAVDLGISSAHSLWDNAAPAQPVNSDYNNFYGLTGSPYDAMNVTGATNDQAVNPAFYDSSRNLASWGSVLGVAETYAAVVGELLRRNGYDPSTKTQSLSPSGVSTADLVAWVRYGFSPTNAALQGAGHDGVTIGAMEVTTDLDPDPDPVSKYISVTLYTNETPLPNLTGLTAIWWDAVPPAGTPVFTTSQGVTNGNGTITLNLTEYTELNATQNGFLFVYEHNATDFRKSRLFGSQLSIYEQ